MVLDNFVPQAPNDPPAGTDMYRIQVNMPGGNCLTARRMSLGLADELGALLSNNALPTTPPAIPPQTDWSGSSIDIDIEHDGLVRGVLTSLTVVSTDTAPPTVLSVAATPSVLWPPNGQMVNVTVTADISDDSGVASAALLIEDEYGEISGQTPMALDPVSGLWKAAVQLRAARNGTDKTDGGRVYLMRVQATDTVGNASAPSTVGATVLVPHSQGKAKK